MKKKTNMKNTKRLVMVGGLIMALGVCGVSAYFTDADTAVNTFTVGKVSIDLQETDWIPPEDITPEEEFDKTPTVVNDGINDAYVFLEVTVPCVEAVTANEDGTKNAAADTQLFTWAKKNGWVLIEESGHKTDNTHTYVYAYGTADALTSLAAGQTTEALFENVEFANMVEGSGLEETSLDIVINGYAIQTDNINDDKGDTFTGENADGKIAPAEVWNIVEKQAK